MELDDLYAQMQAAKAEMGQALAEMLKDPLNHWKYRNYIEARQHYWKLADGWLTAEAVKNEQPAAI
jgi:chromosome condensin MukBEF ATPase and DNA-binding subunit MukB